MRCRCFDNLLGALFSDSEEMKLRIEAITDRGIPNSERLHLRVVEATNLMSHVILVSAYVGETQIANGALSSFWLPPIDVAPGDQVILYSRAGTYVPPPPSLPGFRTFFFYWGNPQTLWNTPSACAMVLDLASWQTSPNAINQLATGNAFTQLKRPFPT